MFENFKNPTKTPIFATILIVDKAIYAVYQIHANYYDPLGGMNFFHSLAGGIGVCLEPSPNKGLFVTNFRQNILIISTGMVLRRLGRLYVRRFCQV